MITLGGRSFSGPFLLPLWSAPRAPSLYAVMVPGWRLLTFRALHFDQAESLSADRIKSHPRYGEWIAAAGTEWNLYIATHEMSFSTDGQRQSVQQDVAREYRPEFSIPVPNPELPGLRTMLLARALRTQTER
ncbi:MAG TPA: hypothetical protein VG873_11145 [Burkholderiales bacterium]|nr:hypothetical protein [Burkholderiales bacterium]